MNTYIKRDNQIYLLSPVIVKKDKDLKEIKGIVESGKKESVWQVNKNTKDVSIAVIFSKNNKIVSTRKNIIEEYDF